MPPRRKSRRPTRARVVPPPEHDPLLEALGDASFYGGEVAPLWPNVEDANLGLGFGPVWFPREGGDDPPTYQVEIQHRFLQLLSRHLTATSPHVLGCFERLGAYTIAQGYTWKVSSKKKRAPQDLIDLVQDHLDAFLDETDFSVREQEVFLRSRRDGEAITRLFPQPDGTTLLRFAEPELLREPSDMDAIRRGISDLRLQEAFSPAILEAYFNPDDTYSTTFGVITPSDDLARPFFYHFLKGPNTSEGELVPATEVVHFRSNVDSGVKRGVSDLFSLQSQIQGLSRFILNMQTGSAIQMAIAFIRQAAAGTTPGALSSLVAQGVDQYRERPTPGGGLRQDMIERYDPGTIINTTANTQYLPPPLASAAAGSFTTIGDFLLRAMAVRWSMPSGMFSSSSDSSYASAIAAESPFARTIEQSQARYKAHFQSIIWKALLHWATITRPMGLSPDEFTRLIEITGEPPSLIQRNAQEEVAVQETLFKNGLLSARTWSQLQGLDWDQEQENLRRERQEGFYPPTPITQPSTNKKPRIPTEVVHSSLRRDLGQDRNPYTSSN